MVKRLTIASGYQICDVYTKSRDKDSYNISGQSKLMYVQEKSYHPPPYPKCKNFISLPEKLCNSYVKHPFKKL